VNPSGPGAFVEPMLERALKISCSDGMVQRLTLLQKRWRFEVEKSEVKCEEKQFPMSLRSVIHAPEGSLRKSTEALLLLMRVET
jgi:hypothetical protein